MTWDKSLIKDRILTGQGKCKQRSRALSLFRQPSSSPIRSTQGARYATNRSPPTTKPENHDPWDPPPRVRRHLPVPGDQRCQQHGKIFEPGVVVVPQLGAHCELPGHSHRWYWLRRVADCRDYAAAEARYGPHFHANARSHFDGGNRDHPGLHLDRLWE